MPDLSVLKVREFHETMLDDAFVDLPPGIYGWGFVMLGNNEEWAHFSFSSAGVSVISTGSINAVTTDTDTKFCIFDNGSNVRIRNRLGSAKDFTAIIYSYK